MANKNDKRRSGVDAAMAGFAAVAVGFLAWAMPNPVFTDLVVGSGLPEFVPAAQPPLGATARIAVLVVAAAVTFVIVFALLNALGKPKRRPRAGDSGPARIHPRQRGLLAREMPAEDIPLPRLRRADAHPDAPSRRPLFAGRELGDPAVTEALAELAAEDDSEWEEHYPRDMSEEPAWEHADYGVAEAEPIDTHLEEAPDEQAEPTRTSEPTGTEAEVESVEPESFETSAAEPEVEPEPFKAAEAASEDAATAYHADPLGEQAEEPEQQQSHDQESLGELVQRLEQGLRHRGGRSWSRANPVRVPEASPPVSGLAADERLRSAIKDLQKLASRG